MTENNEERPLVTFALFAYNQERFIREAVEGALAQTYSPLEIIISDDCSMDATWEIINEVVANYCGKHKIILNKNERNLGLAEHINRVISICKGEIVVVAAGDDISLPKRTALLVEPFLRKPNVMGAHSAVNEIDEYSQFIKIRNQPYCGRFNDLFFIIKNGISVVSQAHAFRKNVFEKFGPLRAEVNNEGKVFAFREAALGEIVWIEEPTVNYRIGVGISSPSNGDVDSLTIDDPVKYCSWRLYALRQIKQDIKKLLELSPVLCREIEKELNYFENLYRINKDAWEFSALLRILISRLNSFRALKAFARRNSPRELRRIYLKKFNKLI